MKKNRILKKPSELRVGDVVFGTLRGETSATVVAVTESLVHTQYLDHKGRARAGFVEEDVEYYVEAPHNVVGDYEVGETFRSSGIPFIVVAKGSVYALVKCIVETPIRLDFEVD